MTDDVATPLDAMEAYYAQLRANNFDALWRGATPSRNSPGRRPAYAAHHWAWSDICPALMRAGEIVQPGPDAERRVIQLINPALPAARAASHTLTANVQLVLPGEISPSHRHSVAAIRFIIDGDSAVTVVDGEPIRMRPGDLVLTPGGSWHGHVNCSDTPAIWMDSLDRPLNSALGQRLQEPYGSELQEATRTTDEGLALFGSGLLQPIDRKSRTGPVSPVMRYPWEDARRALEALARVRTDPFDDIVMDYVNPLTGGHLLPTIGCRIQMIRKGIHTQAHRHAHVSVYHVVDGSGVTIVEGDEIVWSKGDFFVVPPWSWHEHINGGGGGGGGDAYLFSTLDAPVLDALNLAGEDAFRHNGGRQRGG